MTETLSTIAVVAYILAVVFAVIAITLFIILNIPAIWGDLSGKNARKTLEKMRIENEKNKKYAPVKTVKTSKLDSMTKKAIDEEATTVLGDNEATTVLESEEETAVLGDAEETVVLTDENATMLLFDDETTLLDDMAATTLLNDTETGKKANKKKNGLSMIEDEMMIHTNESI